MNQNYHGNHVFLHFFSLRLWLVYPFYRDTEHQGKQQQRYRYIVFSFNHETVVIGILKYIVLTIQVTWTIQAMGDCISFFVELYGC